MSRDREKPSSSRSSHRERDHQSSKKDKKKKEKKEKKSKDKRHRGDDSDGDKETKLPRGVQKISEDDYFLRATEFRVWLKQRKNKYVEELSSDEAVRLFTSKFVTRWNSGRLDRMYYEGIPERVLETTKRTRHTWGFVQKLNEKERMDLATAKDSVGVSTRKADLLVPDLGPARPTSKYGTDLGGAPAETHDRKRGREDHDDDDGDDHRHRRRVEDKRARRHHETVLDELAPRETGREALLEKRRQVGDKLHGAARDRDANRDGLDLDDAFLMGGGARGDDQLQKRLSQRADARQRRGDEMRERAAAAEAKEAARMDKFLQDMGIAPNGSGDRRPITIQPRRDA